MLRGLQCCCSQYKMFYCRNMGLVADEVTTVAKVLQFQQTQKQSEVFGITLIERHIRLIIVLALSVVK